MSAHFHDPEKEKFVGAWLTLEFYEALLNVASEQNTTTSDQIRRAVERYVRDHVIESRR